MSDRAYVFSDAADAAEFARLSAIEALYDPSTREHLEAMGMAPGLRCLEVGPGAGSIMNWLCEVVGSDGQVVAVDLHPRFVQGVTLPQLTVRQADITRCELPAGYFDVAHARYVLLHIPGYLRAFEAMIAALRPGGWLLLEEPDFSTAIPAYGGEDGQMVARVNRAVVELYASMGIEPTLGGHLPALYQRYGLQGVAVSTDYPLVNGGTPMARMMGQSIRHLESRLLSTGVVTAADIDRYVALAEDPGFWAFYYTTVTVRGRIPS